LPYITQDKRAYIHPEISELARKIKAMEGREGVMNYTISELINLVYGPDLRYKDVNEIVGMLECAKQEFYRVVAGPYEQEKLESNGKVY
jgi:hypothetical protein